MWTTAVAVHRRQSQRVRCGFLVGEKRRRGESLTVEGVWFKSHAMYTALKRV
jgi:hypothetical protein